MPRIRTLTAVGVLAGATVLGGAGLAGATDGAQTEEKDVEEVEQTQELTTFEGEEEIETETDAAPTPPELPETAADRAHTALAEAPAFAEDEAQPSEAEVQPTEDQTTSDDEVAADDDGAEATAPDDHGQRVSEVARSDDPGPGPDHGPAVSAEAKKHGQAGDTEED